MTPIPEPIADLHAQIAAMLDPRHPKKAVLIVPGNEVPALPDDVVCVKSSSGTLLTRDPVRAATFADGHEHDATMAWILGYPQDKAVIIAECGVNAIWQARAVQARDAQGNVVTEAFASPSGLVSTEAAMGDHVPTGGSLVLLTPIEAIVRRITMRLEERA